MMRGSQKTLFSRLNLPKLLVLLVLLLLVTVVLAWMAARTEAKGDDLHAQIRSHQMLLPYVSGLSKREALVKELLQSQVAQAQPKTVDETLDVLNQLAVSVGMPDTRFMPKAVSVIGRNDIEVTGIARGDSEHFRRFVVALSHQPWVRSFEHFKVYAGTDKPTFEVTLRTTYGVANKALGAQQ